VILSMNSLDDLKDKINNIDFKQVSEKMRTHNIDRKESILESWKKY